jgi:hypothetical protein
MYRKKDKVRVYACSLSFANATSDSVYIPFNKHIVYYFI